MKKAQVHTRLINRVNDIDSEMNKIRLKSAIKRTTIELVGRYSTDTLEKVAYWFGVKNHDWYTNSSLYIQKPNCEIKINHISCKK